MKHADKWKPSKYVFAGEKLVASRDPSEVGIASRLMADLVAQFYAESLRYHAKGRLLDLGCGKVPLYAAYKEYVTDIVCVDWENTEHKSEHLDLEHDLTKPSPFQDEEFDTIILSDVLEHIPQPEDLFQEMSRLLAIDGKIIMNVPFYYWLHERPNDYYRYTEFALRRFVENAGLELILLDSIGGAPEVLADLLAKVSLGIPGIGRPFSKSIQWTTKQFISTRIGRKFSQKTRDVFPLGYVLVAQKPKRAEAPV